MQTFEFVEMKVKTGNFVSFSRGDYAAKMRLVKVAQSLLKQI
jgi:hypothetical protein